MGVRRAGSGASRQTRETDRQTFRRSGVADGRWQRGYGASVVEAGRARRAFDSVALIEGGIATASARWGGVDTVRRLMTKGGAALEHSASAAPDSAPLSKKTPPAIGTASGVRFETTCCRWKRVPEDYLADLRRVSAAPNSPRPTSAKEAGSGVPVLPPLNSVTKPFESAAAMPLLRK